MTISRSHTSTFGYSLTRRYPFRWFTPLVIIGGLVATVLLSWLNIGSSGYNLLLEVTSDPNSTTQNTSKWWPTLLGDRIQPACQPVTIDPSVSIRTNCSLFSYKAQSIQNHTQQHAPHAAASLVYNNELLNSCEIYYIQIEMRHRNNPSMNSWVLSWQPVVNALIRCNIWEGQATYLEMTYDPTNDIYLPDIFYESKYRNDEFASRAWANVLIRLQYIDLATTMEKETFGSQSATNNGETYDKSSLLVFLSQSTNEVDQADISSQEFFVIGYRYIPDTDRIDAGNLDASGVKIQIQALKLNDMIHNNSIPFRTMWEPLDRFGKSVFSAVMTDLGQRDQPNIISDPELLETFTANASRIVQETAMPLRVDFLDKLGPIVPFQADKDAANSLDIHPTVFSANYICQVPHRKPWPELITSILVADLIFLRALWWLVNFFATQWLSRKNKSMNSCESCFGQGKDEAISIEEDSEDRKKDYASVSQTSLERDLELGIGEHRTWSYTITSEKLSRRNSS